MIFNDDFKTCDLKLSLSTPVAKETQIVTVRIRARTKSNYREEEVLSNFVKSECTAVNIA